MHKVRMTKENIHEVAQETGQSEFKLVKTLIHMASIHNSLHLSLPLRVMVPLTDRKWIDNVKQQYGIGER